MKARLWSVEVAGRDTDRTTYSVLSKNIEGAISKALKRDRSDWEGDTRGKRREVIMVSLDDDEPIL